MIVRNRQAGYKVDPYQLNMGWNNPSETHVFSAI